MSCLRMRRTQLASQVSPVLNSHQAPAPHSRHPTTPHSSNTPHLVIFCWVGNNWRVSRDLEKRLLGLWNSPITQWLTFAMIAAAKLPTEHASLFINQAHPAHLRHWQSSGKGGLRLYFPEISCHRPWIRCHCRWRWRSWFACGFRSCWSGLQHGLHIQALPDSITYCSRTGWYQCCSRKVSHLIRLSKRDRYW